MVGCVRRPTIPNFLQFFQSRRAIVSVSGPGGGDIQVQGRQISLTGGSQIEANTLGEEMGGSLVVSASESVEIRDRLADGTPSALQTRVESTATGEVWGECGKPPSKCGKPPSERGRGEKPGFFSGFHR